MDDHTHTAQRVPPLDANVACRCDSDALPCLACYLVHRRHLPTDHHMAATTRRFKAGE